ncbi:MAG: hypothetical protein ACPLW7_00465 [Minisyncoccia bacterium]
MEAVMPMNGFMELTEDNLMLIDGGKLGWNDMGFYLSGLGGGAMGSVIAGSIYGSSAGPAGALIGAIVGGGVYWLLDQ